MGGVEKREELILLSAYTQVNVLFSEQADAEALLNEAYKQGILGKDFVWIGADAIHTINLTKYLYSLFYLAFLILLLFC